MNNAGYIALSLKTINVSKLPLHPRPRTCGRKSENLERKMNDQCVHTHLSRLMYYSIMCLHNALYNAAPAALLPVSLIFSSSQQQQANKKAAAFTLLHSRHITIIITVLLPCKLGLLLDLYTEAMNWLWCSLMLFVVPHPSDNSAGDVAIILSANHNRKLCIY